MASEAIVFEAFFRVNDLRRDNFRNVARLKCRSDTYQMEMELDVNVDLYPVEVGEQYNIHLATSIALDGSEMEDSFDQSGRKTRADEFEYAMYGRVFQFKENKETKKVSVYVSFGGLLMRLTADPRSLEKIQAESALYLLMKKASN